MRKSRPIQGDDHSPVPAGARLVIFDLDGTLTRPWFDFDAIRREIGLPTEPRTPILEALEQMPPGQRQRAERILLEYEDRGARESELWDDVPDTLSTLRRQAIQIGLLTRNSRRSANITLSRFGLRFDAVYAREDGPVKPSPEPVLALCRALDVPPSATWVVGDYLFDIQAGHAAGATTVLMLGDAPIPDYAAQADHLIRRLAELLTLLAIPAAP